MNDIEFFSANNYIFLPTKNNPKVALAVDNTCVSKNTFKLYNPFSPKAIILKSVMNFTFTRLNVFSRLFSVKKEKSDFINYLEELLNQPLVSSIYFATAKDKVVLQLQSTDAKIIGYLKYPLNDIGLKHIKNEIRAFEVLSKDGVVEPYILTDFYNDKPFLLLKELDGTIGDVQRDALNSMLKSLEKQKSYSLSNHPRMIELKNTLTEHNLNHYRDRLEAICKDSHLEYKLVYEHGDFTPWNIVKAEDGYFPFDFEFFVEDGLEYFDITKYYYQTGRLLENKDGEVLYRFVKEQVKIKEFKKIFELYLIKEIVRNEEENEDCEFEENMMKVLEKI